MKSCQEANLLMEIACYETSAIPYAKDDDVLYVCPNDINLELESLDKSNSFCSKFTCLEVCMLLVESSQL